MCQNTLTVPLGRTSLRNATIVGKNTQQLMLDAKTTKKQKSHKFPRKITYAQVASKPMPLIEASNLAHLLSQLAVDTLVSIKTFSGKDKSDLVTRACRAVEMVHKTKIIPETIMPKVIFDA